MSIAECFARIQKKGWRIVGFDPHFAKACRFNLWMVPGYLGAHTLDMQRFHVIAPTAEELTKQALDLIAGNDTDDAATDLVEALQEAIRVRR